MKIEKEKLDNKKMKDAVEKLNGFLLDSGIEEDYAICAMLHLINLVKNKTGKDYLEVIEQ